MNQGMIAWEDGCHFTNLSTHRAFKGCRDSCIFIAHLLSILQISAGFPLGFYNDERKIRQIRQIWILLKVSVSVGRAIIVFRRRVCLKLTCTGAISLGIGIKETRRITLKFTDDRRNAKGLEFEALRSLSVLGGFFSGCVEQRYVKNGRLSQQLSSSVCEDFFLPKPFRKGYDHNYTGTCFLL